ATTRVAPTRGVCGLLGEGIQEIELARPLWSPESWSPESWSPKSWSPKRGHPNTRRATTRVAPTQVSCRFLDEGIQDIA
ncbi:MAG: hypothetical protein ACOYNO_12505, partial [Saprospiraceae bacterium]